jgi:hypothetical protein
VTNGPDIQQKDVCDFFRLLGINPHSAHSTFLEIDPYIIRVHTTGFVRDENGQPVISADKHSLVEVNSNFDCVITRPRSDDD